MDGLADVHLIHFSTGAEDKDVVLASDDALNDRAPHSRRTAPTICSPPGKPRRKPAIWRRTMRIESFTCRRAIARPATPSAMVVQVMAKGNRYQEFIGFPDGSVAYPAPGSSATKLEIVRVLPCGGS